MQSLENQCRELSRFVLSTQTVDELAHVLRAVLTPAEIESIAQRLSILDGISTGVAQREIAETLRVGIATVTRGSRVWQENRDCLGKYFPRDKESGTATTNPASASGTKEHSSDAHSSQASTSGTVTPSSSTGGTAGSSGTSGPLGHKHKATLGTFIGTPMN